MIIDPDFVIRILAAGAAGAVIGYERELRGKGAGVRTHFLVAMGACLFMIISQYGFPGADKFDAARVAAGVVGGLGFLGGGLIIKNKHISGLTTAAGIWVTGAIGLAMGGGLYAISILTTLLLLVCMEAMHFYTIKFGDRQVNVVLSSESEKDLMKAIEALGKSVGRFSLSHGSSRYNADIQLLIKKKETAFSLIERIGNIEGVTLESLE